jgi:hypothetical protein
VSETQCRCFGSRQSQGQSQSITEYGVELKAEKSITMNLKIVVIIGLAIAF